jgi:Zn finger protein HypA/HybF involved in hydrogenase expression
MVKEKEVKVFEERLYCDKCETEMRHMGAVMYTNPPLYEYYCPKCHNKLKSLEVYPSIKYVEV